MASRRERRERRQQADSARSAAAHRVDTARTEITQRALLAAAEPYRGVLPLFHAVAPDLGVVPDPAPVPESEPVPAWTAPTGLLPVRTPGSLLGLMDGETNR